MLPGSGGGEARGGPPAGSGGVEAVGSGGELAVPQEVTEPASVSRANALRATAVLPDSVMANPLSCHGNLVVRDGPLRPPERQVQDLDKHHHRA